MAFPSHYPFFICCSNICCSKEKCSYYIRANQCS